MIKLIHYKDSIVNRLRSWRNLSKDWTLLKAEIQTGIIARNICESVNSPTILELAKNPDLLHREIDHDVRLKAINPLEHITISEVVKIAFHNYLMGCGRAEYNDWGLN